MSRGLTEDGGRSFKNRMCRRGFEGPVIKPDEQCVCLLTPTFAMNIYVSCLWRIEPCLIDFDFSGPPKTERLHTERIHHPNACCGAAPYDRDTKGCCKVVSRDAPVVFTKLYQGCCGGHIIEKSGQGCCKNRPFHLEEQDCCDGQIEDATTFPGNSLETHYLAWRE